MFDVSLLRPHQAHGHFHPPSAVLIEGEEEFEVDSILDHRDRPLRKGHQPGDVAWLRARAQHVYTREPKQHFQNCKQSLRMYWESIAVMQDVHEKVSWGRSKQRN